MGKILTVLWLIMSLQLNAQVISTHAGNGTAANTGDGGPATNAAVNYPCGAVVDKFGNIYFGNGTGNKVKKVSPSGIITTVAGTGSPGSTGDGGVATAALLKNVQAVTVDTVGNIYIADALNNKIRKVDIATGIISTIAGTGVGGYSGDGGPATAAKIFNPLDICFDKHGYLYIAENPNAIVRKVSPSGTITKVAGTGTSHDSPGGGLADTTSIAGATGICFDNADNLYIADWRARVYKVDTFGFIHTIVGNGTSGYSGTGGAATSATTIPYKIAYDKKTGNLYIAEYDLDRVRVVNPAGIILNFAGTGTNGFNGDGGLADTSTVDNPAGITVDTCGSVYIADSRNYRIRKIAFPVTTPAINIAGTAMGSIGGLISLSATITGGCCSTYVIWKNKGIPFDTTTTPSVTYTKIMCTDSITAVVYGCGDSAVSAVKVVGCNVSVAPDSYRDQSAVGSLSVYPNPVGDELLIALSGEKMSGVAISNLVGTVVAKQSFDSVDELRINTSALPSGIYFVKAICSDGKVYVERVVKE